jgi:hypothetical protein
MIGRGMEWPRSPALAAAVLTFAFVSTSSAQAPPPGQSQAQPTERSVKILPESAGMPTASTLPVIPAARLEQLNAMPNGDNSAGLSLSLIPGWEVVAGSKMGFRVTTKKQGYVILLDVDPSGRLTQIFPDATVMGRDAAEASNLIRAGRALTIPQLGTPYASFEFVAQPPSGLAMLVAILSDKPVQIVDLPDAPPPAFAPSDALKYIRDKTRALKIPTASGTELQQPNWSFDGKFYLIK